MTKENLSVFRKGREIEEKLDTLESEEEKEKFQIAFIHMKKKGKEREFSDGLDRFLQERSRKFEALKSRKEQEKNEKMGK